MNNKTEFKFGDYAIIEQKRHGVPNEMFVHKVIGQLRSNSWVDVPVQSPATETIHDEMEDVCLCICCGIDETKVRRYRVKDMRHRSPVSAVTDEKKGSTITLQAVNELIQSLESAGELSIKETKVMALAKAFKQLAAENVAMKQSERELDKTCAEEFGQDWVSELTETPATDRIVAGIKADGVEMFAESQKEYVRQHRNEMDQVLRAAYAGSAVDAERFAKQLREGADK